jgi:hypothetical protein
MRGLVRTRQRKMLAVSLVGAMILFAGLIVGINGASGTNVQGLGPLDHYLCYSAPVVPATSGATQFPQKPTAAWLQNQFGSVLGHIGALQRHCNPVQKTTADGVTAINKPNDHLACWAFDPNPNTPPPIVNIANQFSPTNAAGPVPVPLSVGGLRSLCLPSFKSLTAANLQTGAPDDLDHYSCYQVKYPAGSTVKFVPPPNVQLDDQFSRLLVPAQSLKATVLTPQSLCLPTIKIINPNPFQPPPTFNNLLDKVDHLLCFGIRITTPSPFTTPATVFDSNQFGIGQLSIKAAQQLCVPSLKQVPPPPSTTTTTIAGVTTTTCDPATGNCGTTTTTVPCTAGPNCVSPPLIAKSFGTSQIPLGSSTSLTFTIQNPNSTTNLTGIGFNDNLPPGIVIATPNGLAGGCPGGVINAPPGGPMVSLTGATLPPLASCSFKVDVTGVSGGTWTNVTDPITSNEAGPGKTATATILVG